MSEMQKIVELLHEMRTAMSDTAAMLRECVAKVENYGKQAENIHELFQKAQPKEEVSK